MSAAVPRCARGDRFQRRGIATATGDWLLACTVHNLLKLPKAQLDIS